MTGVDGKQHRGAISRRSLLSGGLLVALVGASSLTVATRPLAPPPLTDPRLPVIPVKVLDEASLERPHRLEG